MYNLTNETGCDTVIETENETEEENMYNLYMLIRTVRFLYDVYLFDPVGNKIAATCSDTMSRATTYRKLKKCVDLGLLSSRVDCGVIRYKVTEKGLGYVANYRQIFE